jgi:acetylornithine deacetylase/succinyl-diaminopimelate desuccinylase-like protein
MFKRPGILLFLSAILITWLAVYLASVPTRVNPSPADTEFSVSRAYQDLQQIARAPHSTGTAENVRVRNYIVTTCKELGLDTSIQHATSSVSWGSSVTGANVYNIIARLKGSQSTKSVVVVAHYDSQPNSTGTGDDGANCAAMLETVRALKKAHS